MAKVDKYSGTPIATEKTFNAVQPLPKEQADALANTVDEDASLSVDTAFLSSLNPNLTAEQRYATNQIANQNYQKIKEEQMNWFDHAARVPTKIAFAAFDYIPDVANNIIGTSIGNANGDFENPEDVSKAWANVFGAGTTLGQVIGQSFDPTEGIDTGNDFFITDDSNVMKEKFLAQAQLYGWDTPDQYGSRTNLGSVIAGQLAHAEKDSAEHEYLSAIADTAAIGLQFLGLSEVNAALKGIQTGARFFAKNAGAVADATKTGKLIGEARKAAKFEAENELAGYETLANTIIDSDILDVTIDIAKQGEDIVTPLVNDAKIIKDSKEVSGTSVREEAMFESVNNVTSKPLSAARRADKLDAQLEAEKMSIDAQILKVNKDNTSRFEEIDSRLAQVNNTIATSKNADEVKLATDELNALNVERQLLSENTTTIRTKDYQNGPVKTQSDIDKEINDLIKQRSQLEVASLTKAGKPKVRNTENNKAIKEINAKINELRIAAETAPTSATGAKGYKTVPTKDENVNPALEALLKRKEDIETIQEGLRTIKPRLEEQAIAAAEKFKKDYGFTTEGTVKSYDDAMEFFNDVIGMRKTADGVKVQNVEKTLQWITNGGLNGIAEAILKINKFQNEAGGRLMTLLRNKIPVEYISRLSKAVDEDEIKAILTEALTSGNFNVKLGKLRLLKWQSRIIDINGNIRRLDDVAYKNAYHKAFGNAVVRTMIWGLDKKNILVPWTRAYNTSDVEGMTTGIVDMIEFTFGKFGISAVGERGAKWRKFKNESVTKMMNAKTAEERYQLWYKIQEDMLTYAAGWEGMSLKQQKALREAFKSSLAAENKEIKRMAQMASQKTIKESGELADENQKVLGEAVIYEMHMSQTVTMINPYDMRLMIRKGKTIAQIEESKKFGAGYAYGRNLLNIVFHDFFRRAVLFRIGYIVRNVLETQGRMYLTGHPSLLTNPTYVVSALMNTQQGPKLQKLVEKFAAGKISEWNVINRATKDVTGVRFGTDPISTKRLNEVDDAIYSLNSERSSLRNIIKKAKNKDDVLKERERLDEINNQLDELYNEREVLEPQSMFDDFAAQQFNAGSNKGRMTDPGDLINNPVFARKNGYTSVALDNGAFISGIAEYVARISSSPSAKNVLAVLAGRKVDKKVIAWVNKNKLNHLTPEEQLVEFYWYGPGKAAIDELRLAQDGKNVDLYKDKASIAEYLFGESSYSLKTLVYNFTDGLKENFIDIILESKFTKINAKGELVVKRYPNKTVDENPNAKSDYAKQLKDIREAWEDTIDEWKANPDTAKILSVPKADWESIMKELPTGNFFKGMSDTIYTWSSKMEQTFATVPEFLYSHWDYVAKMIVVLSPEDAAKVLKIAESTLGGIPGSWGALTLKQIRKNVKNAAGDGVFDMQDLRIAANNHASSTVEKMFYNASKRNAIGHSLRFILPFGQAWANSLTTWAKLAIQNPAQVYKAELFLKSLETEGSGWLYNPLGIDVQNEYDKDQPFIYVDKKTGKKVFGIPLVGPMSAFFSNVATAVTGRDVSIDVNSFGTTMDVGSLNLVMQNGGLPGFGPMIQIPLAILDSTLPNITRMIPDELRKAINPYLKDPNQAFTLEGSLLPAWVKEVLAGISPILDFSEVRNKYMTSTINALLVNQPEKYFDQNGQISEDKMTLLVKDASIMSGALAMARGLWQIISPGSSKIEGKIVDKNGEYHLSGVISGEFHDLLNQGNDQNEAMAKMIDTYGFGALTSMVSTSRSGYTPTDDAWEAIKADPTLLETDGSVISLFYVGGGYSAYLANEEKTGTSKLSNEDYIKNINNIKYIARQGELDRKLAAGLISEQDYQASIDKLKATAETVPMPSANRNWREQQLFELTEALKNPTLAKTEAGQALNIYVQARNEAIQYGDLGNKGQYENRMRLFDIGVQLAATNPDFSVMWNRVLRSEVKPENNELDMQGAK